MDVRVQFPLADRKTVDQLQDVRVRAQDGTLVPLADIATLQWTKAPLQIKRLNRQRVVDVYGGTLPGYSLGSVTGPLEKELNKPGFLPRGRRADRAGRHAVYDETMANMGIALLTSFMLVYMLMVILYGSFLEPLIVMLCVPLAIIGALSALSLMHRIEPNAGQSLNLISMIGIIMLFGLVAKNGILLVDYSNTLCRRRHARARCRAAGGDHAVPADSHDDVRDDLRHAAACAGFRRRRRVAPGDGHGDHRRPAQLADPHAVPRPDDLRNVDGLPRAPGRRRAVAAEISPAVEGRARVDAPLDRRALVTGAAAGLAAASRRPWRATASPTYASPTASTPPGHGLSRSSPPALSAGAACVDFLDDPGSCAGRSTPSSARGPVRHARARGRAARAQAVRAADLEDYRRGIRR